MTLIAVAHDCKGDQRGQSQLVLAQGKTSISLMPEKEWAAPDSIIYLDVTLIGENGQWRANADETLHISVTGGKLPGFGSANPRTEERYQSGNFTTYCGKAQAIIRTGKSRQVQITISGEKSGSKTVSIEISK